MVQDSPHKCQKTTVCLVSALVFCAAGFDWTLPTPGVRLPVATAILGCVLVWCLAMRRRLRVPAWPWAYTAGLVLMTTGFIGLGTISRSDLVRELVQFFEIFIAAYLVGGMLGEEDGGIVRGAALACAWLLAANMGNAAGLPITGMSLARGAVLVGALLPFVGVAVAGWRVAVPIRTLLLLVLATLAALPVVIIRGDITLLLPMAAGLCVCAALGARWAWTPLLVTVLLAAMAIVIHGPGGLSRLNGSYDATHRTRLALEAEAALASPGVAPFGHGPGTYREAINTLRQELPDAPHPADNKVPRDSNSQYLVTLVEGGGLAAVGILVLLLAGVSAGSGKPSSQQIAIAAALLALAVGGMFATILGRGIGIACGVLLGMAYGGRTTAIAVASPLRGVFPMATAAVALALFIGVGVLGPEPNAAARHLVGLDWQPPVPRVVPPADAPLLQAIRIEGESYTSATGGFRKAAANDTSGNAVLVLPDGSGKATGDAVYQITIPEAGSWQLRARVFWEDGCSNSVGFRIGEAESVLTSEMFSQWHILAARHPLGLPAGTLTVRIRNIEDGVRLDWFELAKEL